MTRGGDMSALADALPAEMMPPGVALPKGMMSKAKSKKRGRKHRR
jgi:hypothetical protein